MHGPMNINMYISITLHRFTLQNIVMFYQYSSNKNIKKGEEYEY